MVSLRQPFFLLLTILVLALAWRLRSVVILVFGAVVIASALDMLSERLHRHARLPRSASVAASILLVLAGLAAVFWAIGDAITEQSALLRERLPAALEALRQWLASHRLGEMLLSWWEGMKDGELPWQGGSRRWPAPPSAPSRAPCCSS